MKIFRSPKEGGQGLVEYTLILVLVAIVIFAVLTIVSQLVGEYTPQANIDLLKQARPFVPVHLNDTGSATTVDISYKECRQVWEKDLDLKVGTTYADPSVIRIKQIDGGYEICNTMRGTSIEVVYAAVDKLR